MCGREKIDLSLNLLGKSKTDLSRRIKSEFDYDFGRSKYDSIHYPVAPTAYDVISCLTKNDPIDFENFCCEYGYDIDSKSAKKTYKAVNEEYINVIKLFTSAEIEQMQEIQ